MATSGRFLRRFDLGNKAVDGIFDNSVVGAIVTIASVTLMTVLFLSELMLFIKVDTVSHMAVADFHEHDVVNVRLHATLPHIECKDLEVIADSSRASTGVSNAKTVDHRPASKSDLRHFRGRGGQPGLGCTVDGTIRVARAGGSIRVHVMHHDPARLVVVGGLLGATRGEKRNGPNSVAGVNVTHVIHDLGFGSATAHGGLGSVGANPLAGNAFISEEGPGQVRYSLKVVPITHRRVHGHEVQTHTYSSNVAFVKEEEVMQDSAMSKQWLGIEIEYDFTPVMVRYTETQKSMFEFVTSVCAVIGGIYTVSGLVVRGVRGVSRKKHD